MASTRIRDAQAVQSVDLTSEVTNTLPVANGGTGGTSQTLNNVLLGNGSGALQNVAPSTAGKVLRSNGTTWQSSALTQDDVSDGTTNKAYTATEKTKLAGIASGATVNDTSAMVSGSNNGSATALTLWIGTAAQYAALGAGRSSTTIYIVTP